MCELTGDTRIRLSQIKDLKAWIYDYTHANVGEVRRWADGKLHEKMKHGWRVVPHGKDYDLKEYSAPRSTKHVRKIASQTEFDGFVEQLFNGDYEPMPKAVRLPGMNKSLSRSLGVDENTQFIFKAKYGHVGPVRKGSSDQLMTKEEYKQIPEVIRNAKSAYIDKEKHNFFILFDDKKDPEKTNKLGFNKTPRGNYLVTLAKVNRRDELASRENLLVSGRSRTHIHDSLFQQQATHYHV